MTEAAYDNGGPARPARGRGSRTAKFVDRYCGSLLLAGVSALRRGIRRPSRMRRLAILKTAAIGDTVLLSPVIEDIRRSFPAADITLFLGPSNMPMAPFFPDIRVVAMPVSNPLAAIRILRAACPDVVVDFEPWARINALIAACSGAWSLGFATPGQFRHVAFDACAAHRRSCHEIENYRSLAGLLGVHGERLPRLRAMSDNPAASYAPYVVFHPWSGGFMGHRKEWPDERWIDLAGLCSASGARIVFTGGVGDRERTRRIIDAVPARAACINMSGETSLLASASVLSGARAVVSVNTGIMHLAAAVGAVVISLNGPVPARRWGGLGARAINLDPPGTGCGYLHLGFEYAGQTDDCMRRIPVERVWNELRRFIEIGDATESPGRTDG